MQIYFNFYYLRVAMRYETVLFDLDGTLVDTIDDLGNAVNHVLSLRGLPVHGMDEYRGMVGHGIRDLNRRALPAEYAENEEYLDACLKDFVSFYSSHIDVYTRPYKGIHELLQELRRKKIAIAVTSNKFQAGTEHLIAEFFPDIEFISVLGNRTGYPLKPDPAIVESVLELSGSPKDRAVLVGDSRTDIKTARNGGIASIAVTWGFRPRSDLLEADLIVDDINSLREALLA